MHPLFPAPNARLEILLVTVKKSCETLDVHILKGSNSHTLLALAEPALGIELHNVNVPLENISTPVGIAVSLNRVTPS